MPKIVQKKHKKAIKKNSDFFVHPSAIIEENVSIGNGTKIWHFAHIRHGTSLGKNCVVAKGVFIDFESQIGNNVKIQNHSNIYHKAIIEDGVFIGPNVCFTNDKTPRAINPDGSIKAASDWHVSTIKIGQGASIGGHSVILPGVSIGSFALAGSGSVISKDVPAFALVFGNPARIKAFVCKCGSKIGQYIKKQGKIIGRCTCGIEVEIDKGAYQQYKNQFPKKRIWLR